MLAGRAAGRAPAQLSPCQLNVELTPLAHAGKKRALLGTLLSRYLKPGGSGIFLLDIHCYDPPEWCAPVHLRARPLARRPPRQLAPWPAGLHPRLCLLTYQTSDARVRRSLLVADTDQNRKGQADRGAHQTLRRPQCTLAASQSCVTYFLRNKRSAIGPAV